MYLFGLYYGGCIGVVVKFVDFVFYCFVEVGIISFFCQIGQCSYVCFFVEFDCDLLVGIFQEVFSVIVGNFFKVEFFVVFGFKQGDI